MSEQLTIRDEYDSACAIIVLSAPSRRALSRAVKDASPGHIDTGSGHDCSGRICGRYATLLRSYRVGVEWLGVVEVSISRDV